MSSPNSLSPTPDTSPQVAAAQERASMDYATLMRATHAWMQIEPQASNEEVQQAQADFAASLLIRERVEQAEANKRDGQGTLQG